LISIASQVVHVVNVEKAMQITDMASLFTHNFVLEINLFLKGFK